MEHQNILEAVQKYLNEHNFSLDKEDALNAIIYGINCDKVINGKAKPYTLFQITKSKKIISLANKSAKTIEILDLSNVKLITFNQKTENFLKYTELKKDRVINFLIDRDTVDFIFDTPNDLCTFAQSILYLLEECTDKKDKNEEDFIKNIWINYDRNFSGQLDKKEFKRFVKELNKKIDADSLFKALDLNNDKQISYDEFVRYFKRFTSGEELSDIFNQYQNERKVITPHGLKRFFKEKQKDIITEIDASKLIITFKESLPPEEKLSIENSLDDLAKTLKPNDPVVYQEKLIPLLEMTLREFKSLIHSSICNVFDKEKLESNLQLNRPMNDYLISSTHNTYLTGHQLTGESSVNMYSYAMLDGYRLVELDCYNGKGDSITITHGYTMAGEIELKDVLTQLRKTAFVNSDLPVILSIENHLDKSHQLVMVNLFKTILKDLYIFPSENPPDYLPSLSEMKNKFIIKTGGVRVIKDRTKITPRSQLSYVTEDDKKNFMSKLHFVLQNIINDKETINNEEDDDKEDTVTLVMDQPKKEVQPIVKGNGLLNDVLVDDSDKGDIKQPEVIKTESELSKVRGLHGTKFNIEKIKENNYQPWEFVTIKSTKFESYCKSYEKRRTIIDFTQNSLMKAYPQSFDSSNYDPIKCWMIGCQVASMNIQATEDDWTLLNMMFFQQNKKCGYVLKPKKLLPESTFIEIYDKPYGQLTVNVKSIVNMVKIIRKGKKAIKKTIPDMKITCVVGGSIEDDKSNKKYSFKIKNSYLFPEIANNEEMKFDIYEKDFGYLKIKLYYEDDVVGRAIIPLCMMKYGLRRASFYSNRCEEIVGSYIVLDLDKSF